MTTYLYDGEGKRVEATGGARPAAPTLRDPVLDGDRQLRHRDREQADGHVRRRPPDRRARLREGVGRRDHTAHRLDADPAHEPIHRRRLCDLPQGRRRLRGSELRLRAHQLAQVVDRQLRDRRRRPDTRRSTCTQAPPARLETPPRRRSRPPVHAASSSPSTPTRRPRPSRATPRPRSSAGTHRTPQAVSRPTPWPPMSRLRPERAAPRARSRASRKSGSPSRSRSLPRPHPASPASSGMSTRASPSSRSSATATTHSLRSYTYGARRISQTAADASTSYFLHDGLGSVANMTSSSGATQWTYAYEPFGTTRTETSTSGPTNFMKFAGEYLDPTGLYHLRARQYDPATGQFGRPDPVDPGVGDALVAAYVYVANRPTVLLDPSGETFRPADDEPEPRQRRDVTCLTARASYVCLRPLRRPRHSSCSSDPDDDSTRSGVRQYFTATDGLAGYPALDFGAPEGAPVLAVESGYVREFGDAAQGDALYLRGDSGIDYWYGHIQRPSLEDKPFDRGRSSAASSGTSSPAAERTISISVRTRTFRAESSAGKGREPMSRLTRPGRRGLRSCGR